MKTIYMAKIQASTNYSLWELGHDLKILYDHSHM